MNSHFIIYIFKHFLKISHMYGFKINCTKIKSFSNSVVHEFLEVPLCTGINLISESVTLTTSEKGCFPF